MALIERRHLGFCSATVTFWSFESSLHRRVDNVSLTSLQLLVPNPGGKRMLSWKVGFVSIRVCMADSIVAMV